MKGMRAYAARLWMDNPGATSEPSTFAAALIISGVVHLIVLLGLGFELPKVDPGLRTTRPIEVTVLRQAAPSDEKPEVADAFAQVDRAGSGVEDVREASSMPPPEPPPESPELPDTAQWEPPPPMPAPVAEVEPPPPETETLIARLEQDPAKIEPPAPEPEPVAKPQPVPETEAVPRPAVTAAQILTSRNLEIAELNARIAEKTTAYASRPRRKAISASTREYRFANYLEGWRRKVERIGNLNYPEEAKKRKLYGDLILHVAVRADGSIEQVRVLRSSGFDVLDAAAVRIVELAAPFAPFPPDIRSETDILDITRTWQFLSSNRLGWEN